MPEYRNSKKPKWLPSLDHRWLDPRLSIYLVPALSLLAFWAGGTGALLAVALTVPLIAGLLAWRDAQRERAGGAYGAHLMGPNVFDARVRDLMDQCRVDGQKSAVFMLQLDEYDGLVEHHGQAAADAVYLEAARRIKGVLRSDDTVSARGADGFALCIAPQPALDLEICLQVSGRLVAAIEEPFAIDGVSIYATVCIGFCQLGRETARGNEPRDVEPVISCAKVALDTARTVAPAAIRAFAPDMQARIQSNVSAQSRAVEALETGQIVPWFQPQISTDTGQITGFECLARWVNPANDTVLPADFIPQIEAANKMGRLFEVVVYHALTAIKAWDEAGLHVQNVGVNFSQSELTDPGLVDKLAWELDRFEVSPERLVVEILETVVVQGPDDVITRNIKGLAALGCRIDLDDFGSGQASLGAIRRFCVGRIKIDRSFVMKIDRDPEQRRMIRAILTMAERLDLETLAEGVETVGEHALLAQLGCTHVQGFGIGRPMPFEQTIAWINEHNAKLQAPPQIGRSVI